ncbi:helix-turn-helix domain-containing protein [Zavarzinia compransoris]|uniref:PucR family transcriptional regulator n=1 Tax=Zavarzinia marina TaxID=2911065 RepID=UPI001F2FD092|nr:helix-turn-helix domain-containing protein [Zavarzinia marina]MCF4164320.1 helix-turn-helix domain-containing protein [Zavarzinia marina]
MATKDEADIRHWVCKVATVLAPAARDIGDAVAAHITARMPEVGGDAVAQTVRVTCRANIASIFDNLRRGEPSDAIVPSEEVMALTRDLVKLGVSGTFVFRAYPIGMQRLIDIWADAVGDHGPRGHEAVAVVKAGTAYMLAWLDLVTSRLSEEHRRELERIARERSFTLVEGIRRVLDDPAVDADAASARIGYPLRGRHVAIVLTEDPRRPRGAVPMEAVAQDWAEVLRAEHSLMVRVDTRTSWCWLTVRPAVQRGRLPRHAGIFAGIGRPGAGIEGFARSHRDALDALRVAERAKSAEGAALFFEEVSVAALCSADPARIDTFIKEELGSLAGTGATARRQRQTLDAFYAANCNYRSAAAALGLHHNTVRYRLEQIEQDLGRPVGERRLNLELALHLVGIFGVPD